MGVLNLNPLAPNGFEPRIVQPVASQKVKATTPSRTLRAHPGLYSDSFTFCYVTKNIPFQPVSTASLFSYKKKKHSYNVMSICKNSPPLSKKSIRYSACGSWELGSQCGHTFKHTATVTEVHRSGELGNTTNIYNPIKSSFCL
jgi:hypothetical protein